ncbi:MAG: ABC transporter ATP-binding protein [Kiritimatiellia bacterium]
MDEQNKIAAVNHYPWREIGRRFLPLTWPHRWRGLLAAVLVGIVGLAVALQPLFPKYIIDEAIPRHDLRLALLAAGVFLAVMFVRMAIWFWAMTVVYKIQLSVIYEMRAMSFAHLQQLCLRFYSQFPSGFLYERVFGNSINTLGTVMMLVFTQLVTFVVGLIFSLGFCLYLSPVLTLVILAGGLGYVMAARYLSGRIYAKTLEANEANMNIVNVIMDKLRGHKTIQAFALEERVQAEFCQQLQPAMRKWLASVLESMKFGFATEGLSYLITAAVLVGGAVLAVRNEGQFPLGTLVAFIGYQATLIGMISAITNMYGQIMGARTAFDQLFSVLDTKSTVVDQPGAVMPKEIQPCFDFRDITFCYGETPVLRNMNLAISAGKTTALVGRSGSGKSTLANLMMRFYDPVNGAVLLDGHDIRDLPLREYRALFGVVLQDPFLFDTTIEDNMRAVRPDVSEAELIEVLRQAGAWAFVEAFPAKLRHRVGEGGSQLSGGQRQRLALARCLLTRSRVVILDEATSALDAESERLVQQGFEALCRDRTVVVIAHRLSTIRHADRIVVMDQGQAVEQGTFDELLAMGGHFARLHAIATSTSTKRIKMEEAGFA